MIMPESVSSGPAENSYDLGQFAELRAGDSGGRRLLQGKTYGTIASELIISENTKELVKNIYSNSRCETDQNSLI